VAVITGAVVQVAGTGEEVSSDCFGNNAAIECPSCHAHPVLLIARPHQRGSSSSKPAECRKCGARIYIAEDLGAGSMEIKILKIALGTTQT